ncbi:MAG: hypothetical protein HPY61_06090 [Methanotrichaceae archaeon]|nr:hypothetical protein [Methanotrichaceae archaeon]
MIKAESVILALIVVFMALSFPCSGQAEQGALPEGVTVPLCRHINASETQVLDHFMTPNLSSVSFILTWGNASFDLMMALRKPDGAIVNSSADLPVVFQRNRSLQYYIIPDPEPGEWRADVFARTAPEGGMDCCLVVLEETASEPTDDSSDDAAENQSSEVCLECSQDG